MRVYAITQVALFTKRHPQGYRCVRVTSRSNPEKSYVIDVDHGRCSCPAWIYQKDAQRQPCKHLLALGFKAIPQTMEIAEPKQLAFSFEPAYTEVL